MTGLGFDAPAAVPDVGIWDGAGLGARGTERDPGRPLVAVIFYRAHLVAGNTTSVADLCAAIELAGADALPIWTYSLRGDAEGGVRALDLCREHGVDVIVTSTLAAGSADDDGEGWSVPGADGLAIPVIQAPATGRSRAAWAADDAGLSPFDVATGVAIPEFDGRIIGPTFAFKEVVDDGDQEGGDIVATRADPERTARLVAVVDDLLEGEGGTDDPAVELGDGHAGGDIEGRQTGIVRGPRRPAPPGGRRLDDRDGEAVGSRYRPSLALVIG